jgi:hypothetical protein
MPSTATAPAPTKASATNAKPSKAKGARKAQARHLSLVPSTDQADKAQAPASVGPRTSRKIRHRRAPGEERRKSLSPDAINREAWCAWVDTHMRVNADDAGAYLFNGHALGESDGRSLYRWRNEDTCPSFWTVDAWCVRYSLHVNHFVEWCAEIVGTDANGKGIERFCPWALGQAPWWQTDELTDEQWAEVEAAWPEEDESGRGAEPLALAA